ncbi:MAG TPA: hypothetical protein VNY36_04170 [Bacteroidia bacterium]|jgi:hypothetical protein|nr:hypothetical protein [Bacteroidia bacterium]
MINGLGGIETTDWSEITNGGLRSGTNRGLLHENTIFELETILWLERLRALNYILPTAYYQAQVNWLIRELKRNNIWWKFDRLWIFATEQQKHAPVSIINPHGINTAWPTNITEVNSPTWTKLQGYTGNGTVHSGTKWLNTNYSIGTNNISYSQNNASFGVYSRTEEIANSTVMGTWQNDITGQGCYLNPRYPVGSGVFNGAVNYDGTGSSGYSTNTSSLGLHAVTRANAAHIQTYARGSLIANITQPSESSMPTLPFLILATNGTGVSPDFIATTDRQLSMAFIGGGEIDQVMFHYIFQIFAQRVGFAV